MLPHLSEMPQWRIQGRGPGDPPPLKIFLGTGPPSYLRGWKTGPTPPLSEGLDPQLCPTSM